MFHIYEGFHLVDAYHKVRHQRKYHPEDSTKRVLKIALVIFVTLLLWNIPTEWYGIQNLTIVQQRIIAIFAFATLMWILEIVSSWATSVAIIVIMLLFCTDSGIMPMVQEAEVGKLLSYKGVMACFADPVIMLFIGGFVLAIAATKTGLDAQLAKVLLAPFGTRSEMVLLGFLLVTGLFSMFVSNTATAAMMLTFLTPVFRQLPPEGKGRIALAMSIPVAANLGGMGTPIGTPPNTIALKYLNDPEGLNMGLTKYEEAFAFETEENAVETIKEAVRAIRNRRSEMNVAPSKKAKVFVVSQDENVQNIFRNGKVFFATLGYASEVIIQGDKAGIDDNAVSVVIPKATIYMPFAELVDVSKEIERLKKEVEKLNKELARVNGMLSNPNFVNKAPEKKINEEKEKKAKYEQMMEQVQNQLAQLAE